MELRADRITFHYGAGGREIWKNFSMSLKSGERLGFMAPSGFGKTTLLKLLSGYERPASGEVFLDGRPVSEYRGFCPVQLIWQHPEEALNPRLKVGRALNRGGPTPQRILDGLGILPEWMDRYPSELSGGEMQRFCIARALRPEVKFLLADEITSMLDLITQSQIWNFLIEETERRQIGMLIVSHSESLLRRVSRLAELAADGEGNCLR